MVLNNAQDLLARTGGAIPGTDIAKCAVFVPIIGSDRLLGAVSVGNHERENAFGDSEVRLLQTVASSMGVALENARLFDETQRLLKETEQRNAELAVINSVQEGLAAELDFHAIIDVVGDKLREVFATPELSITWYDESANLVHFMYVYEHGNRLVVEARPPTAGGVYDVIRKTRARFVLNSAGRTTPGSTWSSCRGPTRASRCCPCRSSAATGFGRRQHRELRARERIQRIGRAAVSTVSASLGSALENARLFNETQRLFKESEQRAAQLAIINSVQAALAAETRACRASTTRSATRSAKSSTRPTSASASTRARPA